MPRIERLNVVSILFFRGPCRLNEMAVISNSVAGVGKSEKPWLGHLKAKGFTGLLPSVMPTMQKGLFRSQVAEYIVRIVQCLFGVVKLINLFSRTILLPVVPPYSMSECFM